MRVWSCDSDNHLVRIESNNLFGNLSDSFTHSHTLESNHHDDNNLNNENFNARQPIRIFRDYLQSIRSSTYHVSFFQLMQIILILSPV